MRTASLLPLLIPAIAAPLLCIPCAGQTSPAEKPAVESKGPALEIRLPVVVRDKHGAPVTDLSAGELALTDNGQPQTIKALTPAAKSPLRLGLLVDTSPGMQRAMDAERKSAEKFVDAVLTGDPPGGTGTNQAFLIHFDREVELLQDFTDSRAKLNTNLEQMGPTQAPERAQGPDTSDGDVYSGSRSRHRGSPQLYDAIYLAANDLMKSQHGRKALVVFSDGVDGGSKESLNEAIDAALRAKTPVYAIYFRGEEQRFERGFSSGRRGGIGGLPGGGGWPGGGGGYPGGGYPGGGGRGSKKAAVDGKKILQEVAMRTGGVYFEAKKTAEFDEMYSRIGDDLRGQYLLSYTPKLSEDQPSFHKIELKVTKGNYNVSTPEGYYAAQPESQ